MPCIFSRHKWYYEALNDHDTAITAADLRSVLDSRTHNHLFSAGLAGWEAGWRRWINTSPNIRTKYEPYLRQYQRLLLEQTTIISYMVAYMAFWGWIDLSLMDDTIVIGRNYSAALDDLLRQHLDLTADLGEIKEYLKKVRC